MCEEIELPQTIGKNKTCEIGLPIAHNFPGIKVMQSVDLSHTVSKNNTCEIYLPSSKFFLVETFAFGPLITHYWRRPIMWDLSFIIHDVLQGTCGMSHSSHIIHRARFLRQNPLLQECLAVVHAKSPVLAGKALKGARH